MRIEPRFAYQVPVALLRSATAGPRQEIGCRLEDLSLSGLRVSLRDPIELAPGERVYLTLTIKEVEVPGGENNSVTVSLRADVVWCRDRQLGLRIENINDTDMPAYRELIENLKP